MKPALGAVLLAAGGSRRLGRPKQLVRLDGEPLVRRAARLLLALKPAAAVVVVGADATAVRAALEDLPLDIRENPDWRGGMGGSIATGVAALDRRFDGLLLLPCDQWRLERQDLCALIGAWEDDPACIAVARWRGACGPPAIFPRRLFASLRALRGGDHGARPLIEANRDAVRFVDIGHAAEDLDTPADLARAQARRSPHSDG